jgi:butyryl-CoA dehydrogenase
MPVYHPPLRDMRFVLGELNSLDDLLALPGYEDLTPDLLDQVLSEGAKFCAEVLHPLNQPGDAEGCSYENGTVRTPKGFPEAYRAFREGGWTALACESEHGGMGMPHALHVLIDEVICSCNLSFSLYPGLTFGAYQTLAAHGSDALRDVYLKHMVDGVWTATMCLTEPHCGTDLGLVRTQAKPQADGSYKIAGTKIFITGGEHDLAENIIHLVLARLPDAPGGTQGISLFLVPKFLIRDDGKPGQRNAVACGSIEHKMGIKASATCVMNFDDATGWLVGSANQGLKHMFTMMNSERLSVGMQGVGIGEAAYQGAVAYARERLQGRSASGPSQSGRKADPLLVHPDIRRMLLTIRAYTEGCRAFAAWIARELDIRHRSTDPERRQAADDFVALTTPVAKALFTDLGFESANLAVQVFGGHGYIRDNGMEQFIRDARIGQIYEGTNGVQALDLVKRKLGARSGRLLETFRGPIDQFIKDKADNAALAGFVAKLAQAFRTFGQATDYILASSGSKPADAEAAANDYLRLFGLVALAYLWCRSAEIASVQLAARSDSDGFYQAKLGTARFFMERLLPQADSLGASIVAGGGSVMDVEERLF